MSRHSLGRTSRLATDHSTIEIRLLLASYATGCDGLSENMSHLPTRQNRQTEMAGMLEPLPLSTKPWESISLDFIVRLPKMGDMTAILVVVDHFSKYATFILMRKFSSTEEMVRMIFKHMVKYWGVPKSIFNDKNPRFTGFS